MLIDISNDEDSVIRGATISALGRVGGKVVVPTLIQALNDEKYSIRKVAIRGLGRIGDPAFTPILADQLLGPAPAHWTSSNIDVIRLSAVKALRKIGTPEAISAVQEYENKGRK